MQRLAAPLLAVLPLALLARAAPAETWLVDPSGGGDFTDIAPAVDAAAPGDTILVRAGDYTFVHIGKPLVVLCIDAPGSAQVELTLYVGGIAAGEVAIVSGISVLELVPAPPSVVVESCAGTVVLENVVVEGGNLAITHCADVRLTRISGHGVPGVSQSTVAGAGHAALQVRDSRVEIVDSAVRGGDGGDCLGCLTVDGSGGAGGPGILATQGAEVHVARCQVQGGDGGDATPLVPGTPVHGGRGGDGMRVEPALGATSEALITGLPEHVVRGGAGGTAPSSTGATGFGVVLVDGAARMSGATVEGVRYSPASHLEQLGIVADPVVTLPFPPRPGTRATFRVDAPPTSTVELILGRFPVLVEAPGLLEDNLVPEHRTIAAGAIGPSGTLELAFPLAATWPVGATFFAQVAVHYPDGTQRLTTSVPIVLR